ncbi:MarR family winged helix-turn-helix transcriptional regulator [Tsukamurella ocularis]|uniref:MarR family winged helix-turn-helix transcriptional regulator n=1 Tax=Tsukamurella ocularis TaxID=1970234 RepID=UPI0039EE5941
MSEDRLTTGQSVVWRSYIESSLRLQTRIDDELRADHGLTLIDYHILVLLSEAPDQRLRMSELADAMVFSRSRLTYQIASMDKRGMVTRERVADDGRGACAVLSPDGLRAVQAAAPTHAATVRELFLDALDPDELDLLGTVFDRLRTRLQG